MAHWLRLSLAAALLGLAGCAGQPAIPFDRSSAPDIKTIGILTPGFPDGPRIVLASSVGKNLGLLGALVDAGMEHNRETTFSDMAAGQRYSAADEFSLALAAAVKSQGYAVEMIPVTRSRPNHFLDDYHVATNIKADAYLDVVVGAYGYVAAGVGDANPYRPVVGMGCKLVRVSDGTVLMRDFVAYNPVNPRGNLITISPNPAYQFVDFDALTADPKITLAGLDDALTQSAQSVAKLLH